MMIYSLSYIWIMHIEIYTNLEQEKNGGVQTYFLLIFIEIKMAYETTY